MQRLLALRRATCLANAILRSEALPPICVTFDVISRRNFHASRHQTFLGSKKSVVLTSILPCPPSFTSGLRFASSSIEGKSQKDISPVLKDESKIDAATPIKSSESEVIAKADVDSLPKEYPASYEIPEPPPIPVEEYIEKVAGEAANVVLSGEPPLSSLGLAGWSPSGIVQQALEFLHISAGFPWWASILTGTIIIRLLVFPLVIKAQRNAAKLNNNMPQLQALQLKMSQARQSGNTLLAAKLGQEMMTFMKEKDVNPLKSMMVPLAMAPVFISFFFALRTMANLPVESFKTGGLYWFKDLTLADPFYILPLITSVTLFITLEVGADGVRISSSQHGNLVKYIMRGIPILIFPMTMNFPAGVLCYWVSTNAVSLAQVSILKIPKIREKLKIEQLVRHDPGNLPISGKKKGFFAEAKESWTNMKITREMEEREKYDEAMFKRSGRGPVPKTYKYDPTKGKETAAAALQASKRR